MRRLSCIAALLAALLALCAPVAAEAAPEQVVICCREEVYAVDLVYTVLPGAKIAQVSFPNVEGLLGEWNYIEAEHLLRIGLASGKPLDLATALAEIRAGGAKLSLQTVLINGTRWAEPVLAHTPKAVAGRQPTCDQPGLSDGSVCVVCGAVLQAQSVLPATGPVLDASVNSAGELHLKGALSDAQTVEGRLLAAVYRESGQMIALCDASAQDPSAMELTIPDCAGAAYVRLLRLRSDWTPAQAAVEIPIA